MTPATEGITLPFIETPAGGWTPRCWYIAQVAFTPDNVYHNALIYTGNHADGREAVVIGPGYETNSYPVATLAVMRLAFKLGTLNDIESVKPVTSQIDAHTFYVGRINDGALALMFTGFLNGKQGQPGNANFVVEVTADGKLIHRRHNDCRVIKRAVVLTEAQFKRGGR